MDLVALAADVDRRLQELDHPNVAAIRNVRRWASEQIRPLPGSAALRLAQHVAGPRWLAYELVYHHPAAMSALDPADIVALGEGMGSWGEVDAFARYVSGPAWRAGRIPDELVRSWAASASRWWRRAALVTTVPLNLRAAGGTGDARRTLDICRRLVDDRDRMVTQALSWALRELVFWDAPAVRRFVDEMDSRLAAVVRREVAAKLETGRRTRPSPTPGPG